MVAIAKLKLYIGRSVFAMVKFKMFIRGSVVAKVKFYAKMLVWSTSL